MSTIDSTRLAWAGLLAHTAASVAFAAGSLLVRVGLRYMLPAARGALGVRLATALVAQSVATPPPVERVIMPTQSPLTLPEIAGVQ